MQGPLLGGVMKNSPVNEANENLLQACIDIDQLITPSTYKTQCLQPNLVV